MPTHTRAVDRQILEKQELPNWVTPMERSCNRINEDAVEFKTELKTVFIMKRRNANKIQLKKGYESGFNWASSSHETEPVSNKIETCSS